MRLLIVSEAYAPTMHAESICTARFARAIASAGHDVTVITRSTHHVRKTPSDPSPSWTRADGVDVRRLTPPGWISRKVGDALAAAASGVPGLRWWHVAARDTALAAHREKPFDLAMTRHVAERTAWIGRALHRAGVAWMAYFADPAPACLHLPPYGPGGPQTVRERRSVAALARMLLEADAIAWACERMARRHLDLLGIPCPRPIFIPHVGGDSTAVPATPASPRRLGRAPDGVREIRIVHAGLWLTNRFQPPVLEAISAAAAHAQARGARLVVELLGPANDDLVAAVKNAGAGHVVRFAGRVPLDRCVEMLHAADGLLLVEALMMEGTVMPTKIAEYALARRPVLAFSPDEGTVSDIVGPDHPGRMGQTREGARAVLERFVDLVVDGPTAALLDWCVPDAERFRSSTVAARFVQEVSSLALRRS